MVSLLFLAKLSSVLVLPMVALLIIIRCCSRKTLTIQWKKDYEIQSKKEQIVIFFALVLLHAVVTVASIWWVYDLSSQEIQTAQPYEPMIEKNWQVLLEDTGFVGSTLNFTRDHKLLPEPYLYSFALMYQRTKLRISFLKGEYTIFGRWYFFPYCFLIKTPLPLLLLLLLAMIATIHKWYTLKQQSNLKKLIAKACYDTMPLWILVLIYGGFSLTSNINIGHRHIIPIYPILFILAGAVTWWFQQKNRIMMTIVVILMAWMAIESIMIKPHYLAYFNQTIGSPNNAYKYMIDSSLDWGQDLPGLKHWLDENGLSDQQHTAIYLAYFGTAKPEYYNIKSTRLPGFFEWRKKKPYAMKGGVYCISATLLQSTYTQYKGPWAVPYEKLYQKLFLEGTSQETLEHLAFARLCAYLRKREPDDQVGYTILIYRISDKEIREALFGPPAELTPEIEVTGLSTVLKLPE